jgi:hypothetical protein
MKQRSNTKSWDDKLEEHPWKRFPEEDGEAKLLILGSFPPNKFTVYTNRLTRCDVKFFYGSKDNMFWELIIDTFGLTFKWPDNEVEIKDWLVGSKWIISDIVLKTYRTADSAADGKLNVQKWNDNVIENILLKNPIEKIVFTSNWVHDRFTKDIVPILKKRPEPFTSIILISPSDAGLISTDWAKRKLARQQEESLAEYRKRYYKYFMNP